MARKELTLKEHLQRIQRKGGKARWEGVPPEERTAYAKKTVAARWAKAKKKATAKNAAAQKTRGPKKAS
jgi:hypothetical protein